MHRHIKIYGQIHVYTQIPIFYINMSYKSKDLVVKIIG